MEWQNMISGGKAALLLLVFTIGVAISIAINSFVGLFIGGSLQTAAIDSSFYYVDPTNISAGLTDVGQGFNNTVGNLITNINGVQTPFSLWVSLLSVILVLAVFAGYKTCSVIMKVIMQIPLIAGNSLSILNYNIRMKQA